jgi:hypothetical protein
MNVNFQDNIPAYLVSKRNITRLILLTAAFALVFINMYRPFDLELKYKGITKNQVLLYSSLITLTGVLVVVVSRIIMYKYSKTESIKLLGYIGWSLSEVFFMGLFYALYGQFFLKDTRPLIDLIEISFQKTALVLLLPYSVLWLLFSWEDKREKLEALVHGFVAPELNKGMLHFKDEKGALRFSTKADNLCYIEATDNYVSLYYLNQQKLQKFMLRNSMKAMETMLSDTSMKRCHRSYMVNTDKVKVLRREKESMIIELEVPGETVIPISKTYFESMMACLSKGIGS